jgi:hypothetical protein
MQHGIEAGIDPRCRGADDYFFTCLGRAFTRPMLVFSRSGCHDVTIAIRDFKAVAEVVFLSPRDVISTLMNYTATTNGS